MKKLTLALLLAALLLAMVAVPAFAHVHGITPLLCVPANSNSGANAAKGDPITGLIPRDVGNSPLTVGDGGFGAAAQCP